ncbi:hypothetical protein [Aliikangiella sp. IMCC44359]|uniref:hypothetical protein n=1 Tax=Aliikangiella sp. IMCC44359 TaxID=3459125 RepID=UPI00403A9AD9
MMATRKHQWATFRKGRLKVRACASCGDLHLPSNSDRTCENSGVLESALVKAGYRLYDDQALAS